MKVRATASVVSLIALGATGCQVQTPAGSAEIARFPADSLDLVVPGAGVVFDPEVSHDGNGSLRIEAVEPVVVRLYEVSDIDADDTRLLYEAHLRTENLKGQAYLEMWCVFEGQGEYFSRGLADPLTGTVEWTRRQIPFFLKAGENPDRLKLNLVVDGRGTVWIDDIVVSKTPQGEAAR